jgi:hypothetical protein
MERIDKVCLELKTKWQTSGETHLDDQENKHEEAVKQFWSEPKHARLSMLKRSAPVLLVQQ